MLTNALHRPASRARGCAGWCCGPSRPNRSAVAGRRPRRSSRADRDQVWLWLARLPRRQRAALVLRYYESLSDVEIAEVLDCAVGTVRSLISRALVTLRAEVSRR